MIYAVIVDISSSEVDKVFDYSSEKDIATGTRVKVPFGPRTIEGFVIGRKDETTVKTKEIIEVLDDFTAITPELLLLSAFLNEQRNLRFADSLRLCIPAKLRMGRVHEIRKGFVTLDVAYELAVGLIKKNATAQMGVLEKLKTGGEFESVLNSEFSPSAVKALLEKGIARREMVTVQRVPYQGLVKERKQITLTDEQSMALDTIINGDGTFLIHGVTGSGKTEIYMAVIDEVLKQNKSAIMLVPEISLTPQMLGVFRARFGGLVSLLHSGLSDGERFDEWLRLLRGEAKVALGARSAIFAPVQNVGVIIIDEEHDTSYVSESNPRYHTHDIAEFRRRYNNAKLILGSATPSLGTYKNAKDGKYHLITLKTRANRKKLPDMEIIDMRKELMRGNNSIFSRYLLEELERTITAGNQAMIFINRRGFASFLRCRSCGYVPKCTDCEVSLTYHKDDNRLKCHYCGKQYYKIDICPECGNENLKDGKMGTERVAEEIKKIFPEVKILRLDLDTTTAKDSYLEILSAFADGEAQVLVGTQMIAKGHDFKDVTLVGVLDADLSLYISDFRSNETTFQLITQVAGRAGREEKQGKVVIQTYSPNHFVFRYARDYDYEGFYDKEVSTREATQFPPYSQIVRILIKSEDEEKALVAARECYAGVRQLKNEEDSIFRIQAMRAPIKRIMREYRFQVVVWVKEGIISALTKIYAEASKVNKTRGVVGFVEVNPTQML